MTKTEQTKRKVWPVAAWNNWYSTSPKGMKRYDVFNYLSALPALVIAEWVFYSASQANTVTVPIQAAGLAAPFVYFGSIVAILAKKKKESIDAKEKQNYGAGVQFAYEQWRNSAGLLQGALARTYRHVEAKKTGHNPGAKSAALEQYLHVIALIVREIFADTCGKQLCVSLALVEQDGTLRTVKFQTELPGRKPGRQIPVGTNLKGASAALLHKSAQYVPDTQAKPVKKQFENRPYRSFMSWPVTCGSTDRVLAVVSVDSPLVNAFDPVQNATRREQVEWMCHPALQGISLCLLD